jgi:hypothetical protein
MNYIRGPRTLTQVLLPKASNDTPHVSHRLLPTNDLLSKCKHDMYHSARSCASLRHRCKIRFDHWNPSWPAMKLLHPDTALRCGFIDGEGC